MYLFDTDVITNVLKKKPSQYLIRHLGQISPDEQFISVITLSEIVYGAHKSQRPEYHLKKLEEVLLTEIAVLEFDVSAAFIAGKIRAKLEKEGMRLSWADIQIAAITMANNLTLITGNTKHFSRVPSLKFENWLIKPQD